MKKHIYSLDPYKILSLLGDIGGFLELVRAVGYALTFYFVQHSFFKDVMSSAYQI